MAKKDRREEKPKEKPKKAAKRLRERLESQEGKRGWLIAFEGPDGAGKSTQRKLFANWLESEGHEVVMSKWNSSPLVKPIFKARKKVRSLSPEEFSLLEAADYRHRAENEILPALWAGKTVIADPYLFTALARDSARGLELDWLLNVYLPLLWPDMVFYFAISAETSGKRIATKKAPKYYDAGQDVTNIEDPLESYKQFVGRMIQEYQGLALAFNFTTVDAEQSIYNQHRLIRQQFQQGQRKPWAEWNTEALAEWLDWRQKCPEVPIGPQG
jgi:dTMP kinase